MAVAPVISSVARGEGGGSGRGALIGLHQPSSSDWLGAVISGHSGRAELWNDEPRGTVAVGTVAAPVGNIKATTITTTTTTTTICIYPAFSCFTLLYLIHISIFFVLDVQDFSSRGEVAVLFVSDREVVVEGRVEEQGQCSSACRRFQRRFLVPGPVELQAVTSVLSADGVLTITAPKKGL
ncbi:Protein lethal(2)essential for life [Portunus trituberculatus]|uniref:Protein lethal(2)essential for life n=1 Tax=Portunus trituberculatus TaxID=210409 RepID=A0A5B7FRF2_PORTR|nr:Protein lethal(2)essential for life [Portunus trituberculatus]